MSNRYVRIYNSSDQERPGNVLGFSRSISGGAYDPKLHDWFQAQGYQVDTNVRPAMVLVFQDDGGNETTYPEVKETHRPLPEGTVSASHLYVEPPFRTDEDIELLGSFLGRLTTCDGGNNDAYLLDNREVLPSDTEYKVPNVIARW